MAGAFASVANIQLPVPSRILHSSWCPDKDLIVVISKFGQKERMSLWGMHGSKKWEIDLESDSPSTTRTEIVGIAWSPDVQTIAVARNPACVTLHSIQNGRQERILPIPENSSPLSGIEWFQEEERNESNDIPEIFKREGNISGSAHSILKGLPLLDPLQDETQPLTTNDLFAFHGGQNRSAPKSELPLIIQSWPTLPVDLNLASIAPNRPDALQAHMEEQEEADNSNINSVLVAYDTTGHIHCFLDGSYPLGTLGIGTKSPQASIHKLRENLFTHLRHASGTQLRPIVIQLPYLTGRMTRDVARVSSSSRELLWYAMRVVKEMRAAWFGSDTQGGARELGQKWVRALESRQSEQFGQEEPFALLDLTCLLTTGRASESLADYLGGGEQMSERGIQKWETTMVDALLRLRDLAEKRVAPAFQRLHLLLQEVQGWSQLPQFAPFHFKKSTIDGCLELTARAIVIAGGLVVAARKELVRFKEFMKWLRYETARASAPGNSDNGPRPHHDILDVNDYLMSGLVVSPIDKWFMGPVPSFTPQDFGVAPENLQLASAKQRARSAIKQMVRGAPRPEIKPKDLSHLDRNLDSLTQTLGERCQRVFAEAASATARSAIVSSGLDPGRVASPPGALAGAVLVRERTVLEDGIGKDGFLQFLAIKSSPRESDRTFLCLVRSQQTRGALDSVEVAVLECIISDEEDEEGGEPAAANATKPFELLDVDFFDGELLVVVFRTKDRQGATLATVGYSELNYRALDAPSLDYVTREALLDNVLERVKRGEIASEPMSIEQSRTLKGCREGGARIATNGRVGRRVVCVLDEASVMMEVVDVEDEDE